MENNYRKSRGKHSQSSRYGRPTYVQSVRRKKKVVKKKKLNMKKVLMVLIIIAAIIIMINRASSKKKTKEVSTSENTVTNTTAEVNNSENMTNTLSNNTAETPKREIDDWRVTLANYENILPENFTVKVSNIDSTRQFDSRAIGELTDMMNAMRKAGITNIWVQSAYRSVARQKELYDASVQKYLKQGKTQEEAQKLTDEYINKPGSSDHNLGLAVDFNYVDNKFEKLEGFKWLQQHAEEYGFVLRYPKDKENITKIAYESWHWRYVGKEHAQKMNKLNMCLEEYVEYLQKGN